MPTFESKFGVGDRAITVHGRQCVIISKILIDESGVRYLTADSGAYLTEADLHPAPPEPEVWPKVRNGWDGNTLDYADGKPRPCGSDGFAERVAKLERLSWQNGPLGRGDGRVEPNGAFVEDVLDAVRDRIAYYQASKFACEENAIALRLIEEAAAALDSRTRRREAQQTEGTHQGN